jgi:N-ethylmaleimide reductase
MSQLLTPVRIGRTLAPNRLVMAPMTRSRADAEACPAT